MERKLRQFLAVAETGNITSAADAMNVSQPTVSVNLRLLEKEHDVPLFSRGSRGVVLTEFGKVLYEHVKVMARLNDHAAAELRAMKQGNRPLLKVACGFSWWDLCVRDSITTFTERHPDVAVHVDISSSYDGLRDLLAGDTAMFIGTKVLHLNDPTTFRFDRLITVEDGFFARQDHPLQGREISQADLVEFPRIDVAPVVNRHLGIVEKSAPMTDGVHLSNTPALYSSNSMTSGVSILQDTDAYLIYPVATAAYFSSHSIEMLKVTDQPKQNIEIGIYTLTDKAITPLQSEFSRLVTDAFQATKLP
jgi:DNA-binding transcriptional LysR family regulator